MRGGVVQRAGVAHALIAQPLVIGGTRVAEMHVAQDVVRDPAAVELAQREFIETLHDAHGADRRDGAHRIGAGAAFDHDTRVTHRHAVVEQDAAPRTSENMMKVFTGAMLGRGLLRLRASETNQRTGKRRTHSRAMSTAAAVVPVAVTTMSGSPGAKSYSESNCAPSPSTFSIVWFKRSPLAPTTSVKVVSPTCSSAWNPVSAPMRTHNSSTATREGCLA